MTSDLSGYSSPKASLGLPLLLIAFAHVTSGGFMVLRFDFHFFLLLFGVGASSSDMEERWSCSCNLMCPLPTQCHLLTKGHGAIDASIRPIIHHSNSTRTN
jgi:hypothetical protein